MEPEEEDVDMDLAFDRVSKVFGLAALSRAVVLSLIHISEHHPAGGNTG